MEGTLTNYLLSNRKNLKNKQRLLTFHSKSCTINNTFLMAQLFAEESVASVQTTVCRCNPVAAKAFTRSQFYSNSQLPQLLSKQ